MQTALRGSFVINFIGQAVVVERLHLMPRHTFSRFEVVFLQLRIDHAHLLDEMGRYRLVPLTAFEKSEKLLIEAFFTRIGYVLVRKSVKEDMVLPLLEKQHGCFGVEFAVFCFQGMLRPEKLITFVPVGLTAFFRPAFFRLSLFVVINGIRKLPLYGNLLG